MQDFINFNKMITPAIIKIIFWIGVGLSVLMGLGQILAGLSMRFGGGLQVFIGLGTLLVGPLFTRVYCEILIVLFKMHETLQQINKKLDN
ncbi:MAG: DUF4282 domain-containing protein [Thermoanaerobacteraceae bacterium]|nr:DUF4282 domain-containing protein [Thermoanaerobacteraceae bacterium]